MSDEGVANLRSLQRVRQIVVVLAVIMLVLSFAAKMHVLAWPRAFTWAVAGGLSIMEARALEKLGQPGRSAYINAAIYGVIAFMPLIRSR